MKFPLKKCNGIPVNTHPGAFGYKRSYYFHPGVDLYCPEGSIVYAMEDGIVTSVGPFTGASLNTPWWNETQYALVFGKTGTICYGEIIPIVKVGDNVKEGDIIGIVTPVIPENEIRSYIPGHFNHMLHIELYEGNNDNPAEWLHNEERPRNLLDITPYLFETIEKKVILTL